MPARKSMTTKASSSKATGKKAAKKTTSRRADPSSSSRSMTKAAEKPTGSTRARRGDHIVIDSAQVGSQRREGEVLKVIVGEVSVSYRVKWSDGHETLISPVAGTAHIVRT